MTKSDDIREVIAAAYDVAVTNPHGKCDECEFLVTWQERHPYGMGYATEDLNECVIKDNAKCPGVRELLRRAMATIGDAEVDNA